MPIEEKRFADGLMPSCTIHKENITDMDKQFNKLTMNHISRSFNCIIIHASITAQ
jgi:hypothetical protein